MGQVSLRPLGVSVYPSFPNLHVTALAHVTVLSLWALLYALILYTLDGRLQLVVSSFFPLLIHNQILCWNQVPLLGSTVTSDFYALSFLRIPD